MSEEIKNTENTLTKKDRVSMFLRSNFQQASFNFERIHALGFAFDMADQVALFEFGMFVVNLFDCS